MRVRLSLLDGKLKENIELPSALDRRQVENCIAYTTDETHGTRLR